MSRAMPNSESIPIVIGLLRNQGASARSMITDGVSVSLRGSRVVRIADRKNQYDPSTWNPSAWDIEINLCGWGDTRTTRNCINSILCRLDLPYRVGLHKKVTYLYIIKSGAGPDGSDLVPVSQLPENGWTTLPHQEEA